MSRLTRVLQLFGLCILSAVFFVWSMLAGVAPFILASGAFCVYCLVKITMLIREKL